MKAIIKTTLATLVLVVGASASQAQPGVPVWHFPYKGAPYATQAEPQRNVGVSETKAKRTLHYVKTAKKSHASKSLAAAQ